MKIGLIGCGGGGQAWGRVLDDAALLEWVYDRAPEGRARARAFFGVDRVRAKLDFAGVDAVVLAVPRHARYNLAAKVLRGGCHVLIDGLAGARADEAETLLGLSTRKNLVAMAATPALFSETTWQMVAWAKEVGTIEHVRLQWTGANNAAGALWGCGPHLLLLLALITDTPPIGASASVGAVPSPEQEPAVLSAWLELQGGATASLFAAQAGPPELTAVVQGSRGYVRADMSCGECELTLTTGRRETAVLRDGDYRALALAELSDCVTKKVQPFAGADLSMATLGLTEALQAGPDRIAAKSA